MSRAILIVGPSGSGKTTVGEAVARELGLPLLSMDNFRAKGLRKKFHVEHAGEKVRNYEDPRMWDGHALACKLRACLQSGTGFVCEGNHLLQYPEIAELSQRAAVFYVDVPFTVSVERRRQRNRGTAADWSFALIGEAMTKKYVEPQKSALDLDGNETPVHSKVGVSDRLVAVAHQCLKAARRWRAVHLDTESIALRVRFVARGDGEAGEVEHG